MTIPRRDHELKRALRERKNNLLVVLVLPFMIVCCIGSTLNLLVIINSTMESTHEDWLVAERTKDVPQAQQQFDTIQNNLLKQITDTQIEVEINQLDVSPGLTLGCIKGVASYTFATDRSFDEVLAAYEKIMSAYPEWSQRLPHVYNTEKGLITLHLIEPSIRNYPNECSGFTTCYQLDIYYSDPSLRLCTG